MKRIFMLCAALILMLALHAQDKPKGDFQIGLFGGYSMPVSTYKTLPKTNNGYTFGLFADKYFKGNKWGLGIDARYLTHGIQTPDSFHFANGYIATSLSPKAQKFSHIAFTLGPTYKYTRGKFQWETFLKGGILLQSFPQWETKMYLFTGATSTPVETKISGTDNDATNKANAWVGLGGMRFNYKLSNNVAVFAQADYLQSFGDKFNGKASQYQTKSLEVKPSAPVLDANTTLKSPWDIYSDASIIEKTPVKALNASLGIKYIFTSRKKEPLPMPVVAPVVPVRQFNLSKDIQVVVKDRQTAMPLSGVKVVIKAGDSEFISISNANGEAERVVKAVKATYTVSGEKNGIAASTVTIDPAEFDGNANIIYKEIFHDDPRFTLIGETVECERNTKLPGVGTTLTEAATRVNRNQISDAEGKFVYQLDQQREYTLVANQAGKYSQTELVSTKGLDRSKTLYVTLKLGVCNLKAGASWVLKNILYDFDKSNIRPDAALILDNVVTIMKENPSLKIELSSHTDSRGNDKYNMSLSQRRAESAVQYLVSQGISKSRLIAKGFGESRLLNNCGNNVNCSEEAHQENRRTEIKVLDY